jgi:hypothetical protein
VALRAKDTALRFNLSSLTLSNIRLSALTVNGPWLNLVRSLSPWQSLVALLEPKAAVTMVVPSSFRRVSFARISQYFVSGDRAPRIIQRTTPSLVGLATTLACLAGVADMALAQSAEQLMSIVNSGRCPAPAVEYNDRSYHECGDPTRGDDIFAVNECQNRITRLNQAIYKYNEFVRQCRQMGERHMAPEPTTKGVPDERQGRTNQQTPGTTSSDLSRLLEEQKPKAVGADAANQKAREQVEQAGEQAEQKRQQRERDELAEQVRQNQEKIRRQMEAERAREAAAAAKQTHCYNNSSWAADYGTCHNREFEYCRQRYGGGQDFSECQMRLNRECWHQRCWTEE